MMMTKAPAHNDNAARPGAAAATATTAAAATDAAGKRLPLRRETYQKEEAWTHTTEAASDIVPGTAVTNTAAATADAKKKQKALTALTKVDMQQPTVASPVALSSSRGIFGGRFQLLNRLGSGGFGDVFRAIERDQTTPLAVKVEKITDANSRAEQSFLFHEAKVLQEVHKSIQAHCAKLKSAREAQLHHEGALPTSVSNAGTVISAEDAAAAAAETDPEAVGITKLKYYGQDGLERVLIMSLHGHSVENVHRRQGCLSLFATVMIAIQVVGSLEHVHRAGYVHADLKPDNVLFGCKDPERLYLVDFGLSTRYRDRAGNLRPLQTNHSFVGTPRYAALRTHLGYTLFPRDDIEQLVYVMIYLYRGRLPWSGLRITDPDAKEKRIGRMKQEMPLEEICAGCPEAFRYILSYARYMEHDETPQYVYLRTILCSLRDECSAATSSGSPRSGLSPVETLPALQQQQQQHQQGAVMNGADNDKRRKKTRTGEEAMGLGRSPDIMSDGANEVEMATENPLTSDGGEVGQGTGILSDAMAQGILSGNGTDGGPLSPRIDCLDDGQSPTCLPLSPVITAAAAHSPVNVRH